MEEDVARLVGPKGRHNPDRAAVRHGTEQGTVTLGGRRVPVQRPRVRAADGTGELPVPSYQVFVFTELLDQLTPDGTKVLLGLAEGATENAIVVCDLLAGLGERGCR